MTDGGRPKIDPEVEALFTVGDRPSTAEQVRERALAHSPKRRGSCWTRAWSPHAQDIDLCMITGAGWPFHMGGLTPYLDRSGISERVTGRRFLAPGVASVPAQ